MFHVIPDDWSRLAMSRARLVVTAIEVEGRTPAEVIAAYSVSRFWLYELASYRAEGDAAFEPRSRRPHRSPGATPAKTVELVLRIRKQLSDAGLDAGAATPEPAKRPKASYLRFAAEMPNETLAVRLHPLPPASPCASTVACTTSASAEPSPELLVQDLHIRVINAATGELLRDLILEPTPRYQPTGRPPGPARRRQTPEPTNSWVRASSLS
jgi:hypothetical protein